MKKALITGITGQDGSYLAEFLLEKGYEVHGIVRRASISNTARIDHLIEKKAITLHDGDLSDSSGLIRLVGEIEPDEIYNLAAQSHVQVSFDAPEYSGDVDALGVLRVLEAVRVCGLTKTCKVYQASTSELYGKVEEVPQRETTPFHPYSPYAVAKQYGFWMVKEYRDAYGMFAVNGILFNHESERRGENFVTRKITLAAGRIAEGLQDHLELGNMDSLRDWGYAKDYVECMWLIMQQDKPEDFVIATGVQHTVRDFTEKAFAANGIGLILQHGTLLVDTAALTDACARYLAELPERAKQEADWLRQHDVAAALCDMPLWSISACEQAGVPLLYVGNFTWTELYREFLPEHIWKAYAAEYRKIQHGMLYALHNPEMLEFLPRAELSETSLVVRPFHPDEIRAVRARHTCPIVFVALGMSAQFTQPVSVEGVEAHFYVTEGVPLTGSNVTVIPYSTLHTQDYVAAADYVVTKAGWGTVAECLLAQKPMALFARDSVLEDRTTIRKLEQKKLGIKVTYEQLTEMSDLLEQMKQITYPAVPEYHNAAAEIVSKLLTLTE